MECFMGFVIIVFKGKIFFIKKRVGIKLNFFKVLVKYVSK